MGDCKRFLLLFNISLMCYICESYKILAVFPIASKSHAILGDACVNLLLDAGHQVTYINIEHNYSRSHQNLSVIDVTLPSALHIGGRFNLKNKMDGKVDLKDPHESMTIMSFLQRKVLEHENIQKLLSNPKESFDVAILEWLYGELAVGIPAVFGCPYIWLSSMEPHPLILDLIGEVTNPAYVPLLLFDSIPPLTFVERVRSFWTQLSVSIYRELYIQPMDEDAYQKIMVPHIARRRKVVPSYKDLRYNASLILGNSHISVGRSFQLPQAYKAIGGYHIQEKREPIPTELKAILDNSTNGFIYFSMGSTLSSKDFPNEVREDLLAMLSGLNQTVLWKLETDLPDKPKNIHILSWAPQQSILAHPNCVLFITHGGQLSILEAIHFGVPLIGIPVFADQDLNVKTMERNGVAKVITLSPNVAADMKVAIEEILGNPSFAQAAKHQSLIYHHRPIPPGAEMVHWVEHVVKTGGAKHLSCVSRLVPWYQKMYLDAIVLVVVLTMLMSIIPKALVRILKILVRKELNLKKQQ